MPVVSGDDVKVKISSESDSSGIDKAEKKIAGFSESTVNASKAIAIGLAGIGVAVGAMAVSFISDFTAQEDALARLQQGLINVTDDSDLVAQGMKRLGDQAGQLQKVTRFADEMITSGQGMLTTFMLGTDTIETLTPSMLDMAEAMRKTTGETVDLNQLGLLFGKVMGGASEGIDGMASSLKRMGVIMTKEQQNVFKFGTEAERAATLTKIIDMNFGGFAEAGGKTFSGRMDIMNNQMGEIKESIGGMVAGGLMPLVNFIATQAVPWFEQLQIRVGEFMNFLNQNQGLIPIIAGTITLLLVPALASMALATWAALAPIIAFAAPIIALGALIAALYLGWKNNFLGIQDITSTVFTFITAGLSWLGALFNNIFVLIIQPLLQVFTTYFHYGFWVPIQTVFNLMTTALNSMGLSWSDVWNGVKKTVFTILGAIVNEVKSKVNMIIGAINGMVNGANSIGKKVPGYQQMTTLPMLANGAENFSGGLAIVGERGPELVNLPRGSDVIPNNQIGGVGGKSVTINQTNNIYGEVDLDLQLRKLAFAVSRS